MIRSKWSQLRNKLEINVAGTVKQKIVAYRGQRSMREKSKNLGDRLAGIRKFGPLRLQHEAISANFPVKTCKAKGACRGRPIRQPHGNLAGRQHSRLDEPVRSDDRAIELASDDRVFRKYLETHCSA